jgi:alpha-beta hydrolase superfamily lysophospholipase
MMDQSLWQLFDQTPIVYSNLSSPVKRDMQAFEDISQSVAWQLYRQRYGLDHGAHMVGRIQVKDADVVCQYFPVPESQGILFYWHGYFDHAASAFPWLDWCQNQNISLVVCEHPNHGLCPIALPEVASFEVYQKVLKGVFDLFQPLSKQAWYLMGHSMGGGVIMDYVLTNPDRAQDFEKIVLLAPLVKVARWSEVSLFHTLLKPFVKKVSRRFRQSPEQAQLLENFLSKDPLIRRDIPVSWIGHLKQWVKKMEDHPKSDLMPLIIQGLQDKTLDVTYNLKYIQNRFEQAKIIELSEALHHLPHEAQWRQIIIESIGSWKTTEYLGDKD